jgi:hypothetical protein
VCGFATDAGKSREIRFVVSAKTKAKSEIDAGWSTAVMLPPLVVKKRDVLAQADRLKQVHDGIVGWAELGDKALLLNLERQAALSLHPELASFSIVTWTRSSSTT